MREISLIQSNLNLKVWHFNNQNLKEVLKISKDSAKFVHEIYSNLKTIDNF